MDLDIYTGDDPRSPRGEEDCELLMRDDDGNG